MSSAKSDVPLLVAGVHVSSDAYPNVKYKVEGLLAHPGLTASEINFPPEAARRFGERRGVLAALAGALRLGVAHLRTVMALVRHAPGRNLYVPYPAVFLLFIVSLLPARWRPRAIHADAFISVYDTVVRDRRLLKPAHPLARLLFVIERRAYCCADRILVDTDLNAAYMADMFGLPRTRFMALPLSINETIYAPAPYHAGNAACTVLFIGTFVPLQGVEVIARAIVMLRGHPGLRFRIIGDGQSAPMVASIIEAGGASVHWERSWQSATALAAEIRQADICLGIFGEGDKAQRVWPLKNYSYMAIGRPLLTAATPAAHQLAGACPPAWVEVPANDAAALAAAIEQLAAQPARRRALAQAAARFYQERLANHVSLRLLIDSLGI